uniref:alanine:cation symporter family protein n=1 Tax=Aeromonas salmonicida TaxID=645 RepID=UPI00359C6CC8
MQAFSVYIDTLFCLLAPAYAADTGLYNVQGPDGAAIYTGIAALPQALVMYRPHGEHDAGFGSIFVAIALFFFVHTIVAYYYIAETNIAISTQD